MRVLGVDPSLRSTGYAVLDGDRRSQKVLEYGLIKTNGEDTLEHSLLHIADAIEGVVREHSPDCLAIENIFTARNSRVALQLGHVRGVVILVCQRCGLDTYPYAATRIKETVAGYGRASKEQVQHMVVRSLGLVETPPTDAADALATALTHFQWHQEIVSRS
ncbi:MAG: crossover junction endodeoxyribonuclease RuvC [bacterium]|nr:crossover junction endodeoxyribonuclease RuvC [bacterium]MDT8367152.1 crossover junction endodeoxyribonuclease RuvC [bacterium]